LRHAQLGRLLDNRFDQFPFGQSLRQSDPASRRRNGNAFQNFQLNAVARSLPDRTEELSALAVQHRYPVAVPHAEDMQGMVGLAPFKMETIPEAFFRWQKEAMHKVAQIFNLLYRRFSTCQRPAALPTPCRLQIGDTAD
jgi:hypothetical protein